MKPDIYKDNVIVHDMEYRRTHIKGGRCFFIVVTYRREKLFNSLKK